MTHVADVVIQSSQVTVDLTDFPVLVDLSDLPAVFWSTVANGGGDIRVYKSDGTTELAREVVSCDTGAETGELWVKYSGTLSSSSNTTIQIHADGVSSDYAVGATYGRNAVWADYQAVYHLGENPSSGMLDSTGNGYDLSDPDWVSGDADTGQIGGGVDKDSSAKFFKPSSAVSVPSSSDFTYQLWLNPSSWPGGNPGLWRSGTTSGGGDFCIFQGTTGRPWIRIDGTDVLKPASGASAALSTMAMQAFRVESATSAAWFKNGVKEHTAAHAKSVAVFSISNFGHHVNASPEYTPGIYDEMRLRHDALSDDWISTEYNNQSSPGTFYTVTAVGGSTTITASGAVQGQVVGNVTLTQGYELAVSGLIQGQGTGAATLTQAHDLTPNSVEQGHTLGQPAITQGHEIAPASVEQVQAIGVTELTQAHLIVPASLGQAQAIAMTTLIQAHVLGPEAVSHVQSLSSPSLTVAGDLVINALSQATGLSAVELVQANILTVDALEQGHALASVNVSQAGELLAAGLAQTQGLAASTLIQAHQVAVSNLAQAQTVEQVSLALADLLDIDDLFQGQTADQATLTQAHILSVSNLTQAQLLQAVNFGGLVVGSLKGEIRIYALIDGALTIEPALKGNITIH